MRGKTAEQLQAEGRKIADLGGFVYHVMPSQVAIMIEYQIPHILVELIPKMPEGDEDAPSPERAPSE